MPKKKPIDKRLKNLFQNITPEATAKPQASAKAPEQASAPRTSAEKPAGTRSETTPADRLQRTPQPVGTEGAPILETSKMSLAFPAGQNTWATLEVLDETRERRWNPDEQLLVKQVTDQLSLALENARLFQETQARAEELAVLNEMGNELATLLDAQAIAEVVYKYTSRLMDTRYFYVALFHQTTQKKSFPIAYDDGQRIFVTPTKVTGTDFTDYVIQNRKTIFAPDDVSGTMQRLGINPEPITDAKKTSKCWLGVPMLIGNRVLGVISARSVTQAFLYDEHDRDILTTIASQAAISLENARLFQEAQRRAQETTALAEVGREVSATLELAQVLERIASYARDLLRAETCAVYLPEPKSKDWRAVAVTGLDVEEIKAYPIRAGSGILGAIIEARQGRIANDTSHTQDAVTVAGTLEQDFEHLMGVPILIQDRITGVMAVWRTGAGLEFIPSELDFLTSLSRQAAVAVENARLYTQEQYRRQIADTLSEMARIAGSSLHISDVVQRLLQQLPRLIPFRTASIQLIQPNGQRRQLGGVRVDQGRLQALEAPADPFVRAIRDENLILQIVKSKDVVILADTHNDPRWEGFAEATDIRSWLGAPLIAGPNVIGILILDGKTPDAFDEDTVELVRSVTAQAAIAIQNARLFEETQKSESELRALFASMNDVIIVYDRNGRYVRIAPTNPSLLIRPPDEMVGKLIKDVLPSELHGQFIEAIQDALNSDRTINVEYPLTIAGNNLWFDANVSKLNEDQVFWVARDITDRKTNELIQVATTQISESALTSHSMDELMGSIHQAISSLLPSKNFYFALYDAASQLITFPYHVDEVDTDWEPRRLGRGLTSYVIRTGKTLRTTPEIFADLAASGEVVSDGARNVDWLGVPLRTKQAVTAVMAVQTYVQDTERITERHQRILNALAAPVASAIERFLAEREIQKFKLGIDRSENAVFITDTNGIIQYANPAFEKVYGFSPGETIGKTPRILKSGFIPDEQYAQFWGTLLAGGTVSGELVNRRKDGSTIPVSGTNSPILDETGKIIGFLAVHQDITERKLSEETLKRRNDYLAASSEIGRLVTSTLDLNTIFTRTVSLISERFGFYFASIYIIEETGFNARLQEGTGNAGEKMKALRHSVVVGSSSIVGRVAESGEAMLANDTDLEPLYQPNPMLLDTRSQAGIPLRIGSRIMGVIDIQSTRPYAFSADDISVLQSLADQVAVAIDNARSYELSQQLIKDLREIDQLKSQFLANMSHELRTPLNSIIGFSRVILKGIDGPVTDLQQQDLTAIYNSGQHLLGLINDILDLARIEAGKMELNLEEVQIGDVVTSVLSTAKGLVKEKPIQLVQRIPSNMPTVRGDTMRVRQVLLNLISNASKFTEEGSITVETMIQKGLAGRMEAVIKVIDSGPGISQEDQEKLFKAFSQVDGSATRKSGGSGLGLSICANLIQLQGGRIGVHSEVGNGSTFWFTLPLYHQPVEDIPTDKKVILAIDDDPQVIGLYERYLTPQGYYVVALTDPLKAKERILEVKPFAVMLDIMMPKKDGWTVLTDLKSDPATKDYPVIICSIMEQADKGFSLGAADYLVKPILEEDLVRALDRIDPDGTIHEVLVIDDDPNDLRLIEKILTENGRYKPILAEGGRKGWEILNTRTPHAIILDIFMPEMDGFAILERLREDPQLCRIPVVVVSGGGLTTEQHQQLIDFGQRLITKVSLQDDQLIPSIEAALKRIRP